MSNMLEQIVMIIRDGCKEQKCKTCHCKQYKHGVGCGEMYRAMKIYDLIKHSAEKTSKTIICDGCLRELEATEEEVKCPCCGTVNIVEEEEDDE